MISVIFFILKKEKTARKMQLQAKNDADKGKVNRHAKSPQALSNSRFAGFSYAVLLSVTGEMITENK